MTMMNDLSSDGAIASGPLWRIRRLFHRLSDRASLPSDVIDDEVTAVLCFKASVVLNRALGGTPGMTFSARAHGATLRKSGLQRVLWLSVCAGVDLSCAMLRGECHHCETAWVNYCRRSGGTIAARDKTAAESVCRAISPDCLRRPYRGAGRQTAPR